MRRAGYDRHPRRSPPIQLAGHAIVVLATILGLALVTLIGVGVRLLTMVTIQQRRERMNRQINERLRTLIAAYKTMGGSFTGNLTVDPSHLHDLRRRGSDAALTVEASLDLEVAVGSERGRRIRDAVEAALSHLARHRRAGAARR